MMVVRTLRVRVDWVRLPAPRGKNGKCGCAVPAEVPLERDEGGCRLLFASASTTDYIFCRRHPAMGGDQHPDNRIAKLGKLIFVSIYKPLGRKPRASARGRFMSLENFKSKNANQKI